MVGKADTTGNHVLMRCLSAIYGLASQSHRVHKFRGRAKAGCSLRGEGIIVPSPEEKEGRYHEHVIISAIAAPSSGWRRAAFSLLSNWIRLSGHRCDRSPSAAQQRSHKSRCNGRRKISSP